MIIAIATISVAALFTFNELDNEALTIEKFTSTLQPAVATLDGVTHDIEIHAVELPDGLFAYRMESHTIDDGEVVDVTDIRYASKKASIPGPTLIFTEGDIVHVRLVNDVPCENFPDIVDGSPETPNISRIGIHPHGVHYDITDDGTPMRTYGQISEHGLITITIY